MRLSSCVMAKKLEPWCLAAAEVRVGQGLFGVKEGPPWSSKNIDRRVCHQFPVLKLCVWSCCAVNESNECGCLKERHEAGKWS